MVAVFGLSAADKTDLISEIGVSTLNGVLYQVARSETVARTGPDESGKSSALNLIGYIDMLSNETRILDDLHVSEMSNAEQAAVRKMLSKLDSSLRISVALARDMQAFGDRTPEVRTWQAAN